MKRAFGLVAAFAIAIWIVAWRQSKPAADPKAISLDQPEWSTDSASIREATVATAETLAADEATVPTVETPAAYDIILSANEESHDSEKDAVPLPRPPQERDPWVIESHGIKSVISLDPTSCELMYRIENTTDKPQFFQFDRSPRGEPMPYSYYRLRHHQTGKIISADRANNPGWKGFSVGSLDEMPMGNLSPGESITLTFDVSGILASFVQCPSCGELSLDDIEFQLSFDHESMHLGHPRLLGPYRELMARLARGDTVESADFERAIAEENHEADSAPSQDAKVSQLFETDWMKLSSLNVDVPKP